MIEIPILIDEMIGRHCRVVTSQDPTQIGLEGRLVDETKNTLVISGMSGHKRLRRIAKKGRSFEIEHGARSILVHGDTIAFRPEDRIKKLARKTEKVRGGRQMPLRPKHDDNINKVS